MYMNLVIFLRDQYDDPIQFALFDYYSRLPISTVDIV